MRSRRVAASPVVVVALAGLLAAALAVASGAATPLDQYAVDHLMPGLYPYVDGATRLAFAHGIPAAAWNPNRIVNRVADAVVLPATPVPATALALVALALARRRLHAARWAAAYALVLVAEIVGKSVVHRSALYTVAAYGTQHIWKFDSSFPSGEAARATFLAGLLIAAWPMLAAPAGAWALSVAVLLVAAGTHTPTDVAGGLCLGVAAVTWCREPGRRIRSRIA